MTTTRKAISLAAEAAGRKESVWGVFLVFLRLGLTSFGGPIAHLGYFRDEFVNRRRWLSERSYADLVALCQFLPGPASSQVGMALGLSRHGYRGAFAAWAGFTLPSAVALILFALGLASHAAAIPAGALHGLKVVAVAVVAQAVWGMARNLCTDTSRVTLMMAASCIALLAPSALGQVGIIAAAGTAGLVFRPAGLLADVDRAIALPSHRRRQCVLPVGRAGIWRRPCRAALAASRCRPYWLGWQ